MNKAARKDLSLIFSFVKPFWALQLLLFCCIILTSIANLALPWFLMLIIDHIIPSGNYRKLLELLAILVGVNIIRVLLGVATDYLNTLLSSRIIQSLKLRLFQNLLHMPYGYFETTKPGEVLQTVNNEVDKIQGFLTGSIIRLINNAITVISLGAVLLWLNPVLFGLSILVLPISIAINRYHSQRLRSNIQHSAKAEGDLYSFYIDRIKNIKLIKTFNAYQLETKNITHKYTSLYALYLHSAFWSSFGRNLSGFFVTLGPLIVFLYGGYLTIEKVMTVGSLVAFIQYLNRIYGPSTDLIGLYTDYIRVQESLKRIMPILHHSNFLEKPTFNTFSKIDRIEIEGLSFAYSNKNILKHISVGFVKGKQYAIVGPSGCGKSTLLKLLCRLYDYEHGTIYINSTHELRHVSRVEWLNKVTIISQEVALLHDTVRNNLLYGDTEATDEALWDALALAGADGYVKALPKGLDTLIGDGIDCTVPSGGQMQQLSLARLFLRKSELVILDETTSAIDSLNDKKIFDNVLTVCADKIVIAVSHRLSTLRNFDEVIYMENGTIHEIGTHQQLNNLKQGYYSLFQNQLVPDPV